jgi:hypothetical protein
MSFREEIFNELVKKGFFNLTEEEKEKRAQEALDSLAKIKSTIPYPEAASEVLRGSGRVNHGFNQN